MSIYFQLQFSCLRYFPYDRKYSSHWILQPCTWPLHRSIILMITTEERKMIIFERSSSCLCSIQLLNMISGARSDLALRSLASISWKKIEIIMIMSQSFIIRGAIWVKSKENTRRRKKNEKQNIRRMICNGKYVWCVVLFKIAAHCSKYKILLLPNAMLLHISLCMLSLSILWRCIMYYIGRCWIAHSLTPVRTIRLFRHHIVELHSMNNFLCFFAATSV